MASAHRNQHHVEADRKAAGTCARTSVMGTSDMLPTQVCFLHNRDGQRRGWNIPASRPAGRQRGVDCLPSSINLPPLM